MRNEQSRRWVAGAGAAALSAVVVGVPTDVIDTDLFTRMTPVRWWEYPVLVLAAAPTGLWMAIPSPASERRGGTGVVGATTAAMFAVGCPVCNKVVVGLLGMSGALGVWAPIQPVLDNRATQLGIAIRCEEWDQQGVRLIGTLVVQRAAAARYNPSVHSRQ